MTPALRDGHPVMALGGHGVDRIPQGMLQAFLNVVEFGMNPQEAVEAPRVYTYNFPDTWHPSVYLPGVIRAEGRIPNEVVASLVSCIQSTLAKASHAGQD